MLNQLIGKSVVRVDDADFRYTVIQVRPFKSETSTLVSSLTIVAEKSRILLYDSDGTELAKHDLNATDAGKPVTILKPPSVGDMILGVVYDNEVILFRIRMEELTPGTGGPRKLKIT